MNADKSAKIQGGMYALQGLAHGHSNGKQALSLWGSASKGRNAERLMGAGLGLHAMDGTKARR